MDAISKPTNLNRPLFALSKFDSSALTVLTTFLHSFSKVGQYDVAVRRAGKVVRRLAVNILEDAAEQQHNVDLAKLDDAGHGCGCGAKDTFALKLGGVMGFYASTGTAKYTVMVKYSNDSEKTKTIVADSSREVPQGDLFALTLVRPGLYRLEDLKQKSESEVTVRLPKGQKDYKPGLAKVLSIGKQSLKECGPLEIFSGQSLVFHCEAAAHIRAELVKDDESGGEPFRDEVFRYRKPEKKQSKSAQ